MCQLEAGKVNALDLLIMLFFGGIVALAFIGGLGKVISTLLGLYGGIIFAAFFYHPLAVAVSTRLVTMPPFTGDLLMFLLLLVVGAVAFSTALARSFVAGRFPRWFGAFDNIGGGIVGIVVALLATVLASLMLSLVAQAIDRAATLGPSPFLLTIQSQMHGAALVPVFLKLAPVFIRPLQPFFPNGLPPILQYGV